ncbi:MAG TPA: bifunctional oligoribonuclease/PAP phosphatase NrnA [Candidatus Latescibacteria bacterium]|nr:bifunctional oligoribonuclease/PAP phosphatase NrnA [Candidatus Latescibacterota bacterium]
MELPEFDEVIAFIEDGDDFLLTSHVNSDGDAIGACLALTRMLDGLDKKATIVLQDVPGEPYEFLEGFSSIMAAESVPVEATACVAVLDCPSLDRIGRIQDCLDEQTRILNIDHHAGNVHFGAVNLVSENVCSTSELLYHLAVAMGVPIDPALAEQLYTGILFDTGGFRYSLTKPTSMEAAAALVRLGARLDFVADRIYNNSSLASLKLIGRAIDSLELTAGGRVACLHLTRGDMRSGDPETAVNYGLKIRGVEVSMLLKEEAPEHYRVSLRSRERIDVRAVAARFGGGGHTRASGCNIDGTAESVRAALLEEVGRQLAAAA